MAEIKIEKKKPVWPWILLVLILLAIVAFFVYQNQADDTYYDDDNTDMVDDMDNSIYNDTTTFGDTYYDEGSAAMTGLMESLKDSTRFGTDSTFTKTALHNLAKLTMAKAQSNNVESSSALSDLESYTLRNNLNDSRTDNSNMAADFKDVTQDIVTVIESITNKNGTTMQQEVTQLKETSSKISGTTTLDKQQRTLQTFFRQAHDVLHSTNS
ncbi:MAG TPA: hypothetical protein VKZ98_01170 [Aquaticitalea sp.]|nr:hypothetical protein [Aquaticitalea sp.]